MTPDERFNEMATNLTGDTSTPPSRDLGSPGLLSYIVGNEIRQMDEIHDRIRRNMGNLDKVGDF
jgi:hypothetical protein